MSRKRTSDDSTSNEVFTQSAAAEPPMAEPAPQPGFAERVGQKERIQRPDPFPYAKDNLAGVRLFDSWEDRQVAIKFDEKPSPPVIDKLKESGYRWDPADQIWAQEFTSKSALAVRIRAEELYQEVREMIRMEKGIEPEKGQGVPF